MRKCGDNIKSGLKPLIITTTGGVSVANFLVESGELKQRVDVLDCSQFLTANLYERSFFQMANCKITFSKLLERYNKIVDECETEPVLRVNLGKPSKL